MQLDTMFVSTRRDPGKYYDGRGHGLYLCVARTGAKRWEQRITVNGGRRRHLGLGRYPDVSLKQARQRAQRNHELVWEGEDPLVHKRRVRRPVPTFAEASEAMIALRRPTWTSPNRERDLRRTLEKHVHPRLGTLRVTDIEAPQILDVLHAVRDRAPKSVARVRQLVIATLSWALGQGHRVSVPPASALEVPTDASVEHHKALEHAHLPAAAAVVGDCDAWIGTRLMTLFLMLTALRTNEVRGARWREIDFDAARWVVPAWRMKERKKHRVPLSSAALSVLHEARGHPDLEELRQRHGHDLVFPGVRGREHFNNAVSKLLDKLSIDATPHGLRSSFRDWAGDRNESRQAAEAALSHRLGDAVESSYLRSDLFGLRVGLMERWGAHVAPDRTGDAAGARDPARTRALPANERGRDLVVGEIRGCFRTLERALAALRFDPRRDRLFSVGDLVNGGVYCEETLRWIEGRFAAVVRGDHEQRVLRSLAGGQSPPPDEARWWGALGAGAHRRWRAALERLPYAVTVDTARGPVGIVHAQAPHTSWADALGRIERGVPSALCEALLGLEAPREVVRRRLSRAVDGVRAVVHGHSAAPALVRMANRVNLDTGAGIRRPGRLTLMELDGALRHWSFDVEER